MDKATFRDLVLPLNQREQFYITHPNQRNSYAFGAVENYSYTDESGLLHLRIDRNNRQRSTDGRHAVFFDGQVIEPSMLNMPVFFNKQTRFSEVPLHVRDYLEIKYIYTGNCTAILSGKPVPLTTGDMLLLDRGSRHRILPTGENDLVFNFLMERSYFNETFMQMASDVGGIADFLANSISNSAQHDNYVIFRTQNNVTLRELIENILCEYLDPGLCAAHVIESYMLLLFIELMRSYQRQKEREGREQERSYVTEVIDYIQQNCVDCTLKGTAEHFNYNPDYLSRSIKKATNQSFQKLLTSARMNRAAFLLLNTEEPAYQIAEKCGYQNLNFFYKKFKEFFQCSPAEYRGENGNRTFVKK